MGFLTMLEDQYIGALLGTMIGDALGAPIEGVDKEQLHSMFGTLIEKSKRSFPNEPDLSEDTRRSDSIRHACC